MPPEISEMEGLKGGSAIRQLIIRVSVQLRAGKIRLIDATPEESAAKVRLDDHRGKRRKRYLYSTNDQTER